MTEFRRVVCPVDFSDFARRALDHAIAVAKWYGSTLTVMYVHHVPLSILAPVGVLGATSLESLALPPDDRERLRRELQAFVPPVAIGLTVECRVVEGDVAAEILAEAATADMIVMGTHGRSGFEHLMLGSVTEKVLRKARCPLLTIPRAAPDATGAVPSLFHHVVVAVDFSDASMHALSLAASLAEEADSRLTALHVIDLPPEPALWLDRSDGRSHVREFEAAATRRLRESVPDSTRECCHVEELVVTGTPYREILRVAAERRAGLVVIGAHGHGAVERMFLGSTAQHIVRQAGCPVLTIRQA
jgi:nucleotide-binding universal stress UspA family protein